MKLKIRKSVLIRPVRCIRVLFTSQVRLWCERLSPKGRLRTVIVAYMILAVGCLWMMLSAVCGDGRQRFLNVEHIKQPELMWNKKDSLNINFYRYEQQ